MVVVLMVDTLESVDLGDMTFGCDDLVVGSEVALNLFTFTGGFHDDQEPTGIEGNGSGGHTRWVLSRWFQELGGRLFPHISIEVEVFFHGFLGPDLGFTDNYFLGGHTMYISYLRCFHITSCISIYQETHLET